MILPRCFASGLCASAILILAAPVRAESDTPPSTNAAAAGILRDSVRVAQEEFVRRVSAVAAVDERVVWVHLPGGATTNNLAADLFPAIERARRSPLTPNQRSDITAAEALRARTIERAWQDHIEASRPRRP